MPILGAFPAEQWKHRRAKRTNLNAAVKPLKAALHRLVAHFLRPEGNDAKWRAIGIARWYVADLLNVVRVEAAHSIGCVIASGDLRGDSGTLVTLVLFRDWAARIDGSGAVDIEAATKHVSGKAVAFKEAFSFRRRFAFNAQAPVAHDVDSFRL